MARTWELTEAEIAESPWDTSEWFGREEMLMVGAAKAAARKLWAQAWPDIALVTSGYREQPTGTYSQPVTQRIVIDALHRLEQLAAEIKESQ